MGGRQLTGIIDSDLNLNIQRKKIEQDEIMIKSIITAVEYQTFPREVIFY